MSPHAELVFALVEKAAIAGARCPQNDEIYDALSAAGLHHKIGPADILAELAKEGKIRGGVYGKNWRRLWILSGPNAGKSTKAAPSGTEPYVIYDRFGCSPASRRRTAAA